MKILVATDGSKPSLKAVKQAIKLAQQGSGSNTVTLISVHDGTALRHAERFVGKQAVADYLRELSDKDLAEAHTLLEKSGLRHDLIIRTGHVAAEIVAAAEQGRFELLLVGSKGHSALEDFLLGSVARRVAETCKVPVLIVK